MEFCRRKVPVWAIRNLFRAILSEMSQRGAVAVDLGASSGRFAAGKLVDGTIQFEIIEQIPHAPIERNGRLEWDMDRLMGLVRRAAEYASTNFSHATLAIDSWGVDHGFIDAYGDLIQAPVCYRDTSHAAAFDRLADRRGELYALTGIQHQPFNTLYQLAARIAEDPTLPLRAANWMILPDLMGYLLMREANHELTQASTTQLMGLDGTWSPDAFAVAGWPVPNIQPRLPGELFGYCAPNVRVASVGSHDTASAVLGLAPIDDQTVFLNVGTWSLIGCILDQPNASAAAEAANFTNERCVDGRVRFLKNVPGFWVINRLHDELGITESVPEWLNRADQSVDGRIDLMHESLFNPDSMVEACAALVSKRPTSAAEWSGLALLSLIDTLADQPRQLAAVTGRTFDKIRVGGGGSQSEMFCELLAQRSGLKVLAGPAEATVLGNIAMQFRAAGVIDDPEKVVAASSGMRSYGG